MSFWKKCLLGVFVVLVLGAAGLWWALRGHEAEYSVDDLSGLEPTIAEPKEEMIPTVKVAKPVGWAEGEAPTAAEGLVVTRFAEGLDHPRVIYTLPNGDVIAVLANAPKRDVAGGGITNFVAGLLFAQAGADSPSANQLVLLRDTDGDGVAETRKVLREGLDSPSGVAWHEGALYVANHNAVLKFAYELGADIVAGNPEKLMDLPAAGNHWMRNIVLKPDGSSLFIAVGSASNIGEGGMDVEKRRAAILELNLKTGSNRQYAAGLRNPNGLDWNPWSGELWTTVNERDMLGSDLVPDYFTNVPVGVNYGWPWIYMKDIRDKRVDVPMPAYFTEYTRRPEFALGAHVAPLGAVFTKAGTRMGDQFAQGAFIARHGSWNRRPAAGYDVVYVAFDERGNPLGKPEMVLESFLKANGDTRGRPTWLAWDAKGALLVSDDTAGIIWRVMAPNSAPAAAPVRKKMSSLPPLRELMGDPSRAFENPPEDLVPGAL